VQQAQTHEEMGHMDGPYWWQQSCSAAGWMSVSTERVPAACCCAVRLAAER
jgi:hypothetical protein